MSQYSTDQKWYVIVNPVAGGGRGARDMERIFKLLDEHDISFTYALTEFNNHAIETAKRAVEEGYRKILVAGGDGTLNQAVNGILLQKEIAPEEVLVAMLAVGRGNDWIKTFGIPADYRSAIKLLRSGSYRLIDTGLATYMEDGRQKERYFINVAGLAFAAAAVARSMSSKIYQGNYTYLLAIAVELFSYKSTRVQYSIDGQQLEDVLFDMNIGICKYAGGGMMVAPHADPSDGLLDVTVIRDISKMDVIRNLPGLYDGSFLSHPKVDSYKAKEVRVVSDPPVFLEAEGDLLGSSPFTFRISDKKAKILVPADQK